MGISYPSAAASSTDIADGARAFLIPGGTIGLSIIHGYGGTIGDYRGIGVALAKFGYTINGIRLAGHGITPEALGRTHIADWRRSVNQGVAAMPPTVRQHFLLGSSFGGTLALEYALNHQAEITGVIAVNTTWRYRSPRQMALLKLLGLFTSYLPKIGLSRTDRKKYQAIGSMTKWPIKGIFETQGVTGQLTTKLPQLKVPVMLMYSHQDEVVDVSKNNLLESYFSNRPRCEDIPGQTHRPFRDPVLVQIMAEKIRNFITANIAGQN